MEATQIAVCERFGTDIQPSQSHSKLGIALATLTTLPLNGLRHPPEGSTNGWYIWGGAELSDDHDFFQPVHIEHLDEILPSIIPYLGLPAGWRFQIAPGHEDVWFDATLLNER
jgi:hypothetical protein